MPGLESSLFITFIVLVILAAIHLYSEGPMNDVLAWKLQLGARLDYHHHATTEQT